MKRNTTVIGRAALAPAGQSVRRRPALAATAGLAAAGLALGACSSSPSTASSAASSAQPAYSSTAPKAPASPVSSGGAGTVDRATSKTYGPYVVDAKGYALYMLSSDPAGRSTCTGTCTTIWPPLSSTGAPTAGPGVTTSQVARISRSAGGTQVTYAGHPLYTFAHDTAPGQTNGEGIVNFGGTWTLVNPSGQPIEPAASSGSTAGGSGAAGSSSSSPSSSAYSSY